MKYSFTTSGLLALAGSAVTMASVIPRSTTATSQVISVQRDWNTLRAAVDSHSTNVNQKRGTDAPFNLNYGNYWFADITAGGEPAQVLLDTGSADLWLVAPSAPSSATSGVETWNPNSASGTSIKSGYTFDIGYGEGGNGVSGNVYQSTVCMGSACTSMAVGSATYDQGLGTFPRSGIMGLAFQGGNSVSPNKQPTFMESLAPSLNSPIMVTKFTTGSNSQIAFGYIPFSYVAPFQEISVDTSSSAKYPYSWSFENIEYSVEGEALGTFDVVFDTGGPMTSAAEGIVRGYYAKINGAVDVNGDASSWTVPCGITLPDLQLNFGSSAFMIIPGFRFYNGNTATSGSCTSWFVKENSATRGVVGDPFFMEHVVVFNQNAGTIQWGNQS